MRSTAVPKRVRPRACKVIACRPHFLKGVWALPGPHHINTPCAQTAHFILLFKGEFASALLGDRAPLCHFTDPLPTNERPSHAVGNVSCALQVHHL